MKIIFLITSVLISACALADDGEVARIYDEWLAQPQKERERREAEQKRSDEMDALKRIISAGNIISAGQSYPMAPVMLGSITCFFHAIVFQDLPHHSDSHNSRPCYRREICLIEVLSGSGSAIEVQCHSN